MSLCDHCGCSADVPITEIADGDIGVTTLILFSQNPVVLLLEKIIRHPSDVIANHARIGFLLHFGEIGGGKRARMKHVMVEKLLDAARNAFALASNFGMSVKA